MRWAMIAGALASLSLAGCEDVAPSPTGSIRVASTPDGARVFLNGSDTGRITPYTVTDLPADEYHLIRLTLDGHADWGPENVYVAPGETTSVAVTLEPIPDQRPEVASGPNPATGATGVAVDAVLSWTRNARTTSFDVYLGPDRGLDAVDFQGNVARAMFSPGGLSAGTQYNWRIDARGAGGVTPGPVWSFTTAGRLQLPGKAIGPSPAHGATAVAKNTVLRWDSGGHTTSYDVYLATNPKPGASEFQGTQTTRTFSPGRLSAGTRYYWRIDAKNGQGTTTGDVWSFTTEQEPELPRKAVNPSPMDGATGGGERRRVELEQWRPHDRLRRVLRDRSDAGRRRSASDAGGADVRSWDVGGRDSILLAGRREERARDDHGHDVDVHHGTRDRARLSRIR